MNLDLPSSLLALTALGAFHGVNPGMGWLFAVALGLQERKASAVWRSLIPLALGHALAVAAAILLVYIVGQMIPIVYLRWLLASILFAFGLYRLFRTSHPRYGGMRVNSRQLTIWSFLMASAHGAGLMVLPFVFGAAAHDTPQQNGAQPVVQVEVRVHGHHATTANDQHARAAHDHHASTAHDHSAHHGRHDHSGHAHHGHVTSDSMSSNPIAGLLGALVHTFGYLLITGVLAVVVYARLGLRLLRTAWVNLDLIWAVALMATAVLTVLL